MEPLLVTVDPSLKNDDIDFNVHEGQEFHYILEGRMKVIIKDQKIILNPGDSLMFNSEQPHGLLAMDENPFKFLAVII